MDSTFTSVKRSRKWQWTRFWKSIGLFILAALGRSILFPRGDGSKESCLRAQCQSNLKSVALAFKAYTRDYDGRLPLVGLNPTVGWAATLQPYAKTWMIFQCPATTSGAADSIDYFYNSRLNSVTTTQLESPWTTVMIGDGTDNSSAKYSLRELPEKWFLDEGSPARRHLNLANYAFADGHVKAVDPSQFGLDSSQGSTPTFALK